MELVRIILDDASGGLNDRDQPAELSLKELAYSENLVTDAGGPSMDGN